MKARTPVEEMVAGIWSEALGVERVGVEDNFFELGGHSLLATRIISRIRDAFDVELPLRAMFESPTVEGLAANLEAALRSQTAGANAPPLRVAGREGLLPLSFAQERLWFLHQLEPQSAFYNMPVAVRLRGQLDRRALARTFTEIIRRHEVLRTVFHPSRRQPVQVIHDPAPFDVPVIDISDQPEEARESEARRRAEELARLAFDLSTGPLIRVSLLRLGENEHALVCVMHHIISDGWLMGVLVREVGALYEAYRQGSAGAACGVADSVCRLCGLAARVDAGRGVGRAPRILAEAVGGGSGMLELPTDRARPAVHRYQGESLYFSPSAESSEQVRKLSRREGVTVFMTLLAAFQVLLWRYTSERDVVVGTPIAGRGRRETEELIGFFVNTLALRAEVDGAGDFRGALRRAREVALGAYAHQDMPFERLVEEMKPERSLSHAPLFQIMFSLNTARAGAWKLEGLELEAVRVGHGTSKFDSDADDGRGGSRVGWNADVQHRLVQ